MTDSSADLLLMKLDDDQKEAVRCERNCVVSAGAGSGKTTVLAYRFVYLVMKGKAHVDEILTLTFSKAAAAEMHERIHTMLISLKDDLHIKSELERFPDATISTIDSFCHRIVSNDAVRYSYPSNIELDDDANRVLAKECAIELADSLSTHPGMKFLASHIKPDIFFERFWTDMAIATFHPSQPFDKTVALTLLHSHIDAELERTAKALIEISDEICSLDGNSKAFNQAVEHCSLLKRMCVELIGGDIEYVSAFEEIKPLQLKKTVGNTWEHKDQYKSLVDIWHQKVDQLLIAMGAKVDEHILEPVLDVIDRYCRIYLRAKRQNGIVTFSDIAHMALDILIKNHEIRTYYKQRFKYIMIDEFQDNNMLQKDLLYLLAEKPDCDGERVPSVQELQESKLFFVGDEKQSIYRFRGADVSVFKELAKELTDCGGRHIELKRNYRSHPQLVQWFNDIFTHIMEPGGQPFEAEFTPLKKIDESPSVHSSVSLYFKPYETEPSALEDDEEQVSSVEAEAYMISQLIHEMTESDAYMILDKDKNPRRPSYDDIAILYRTSSNQLHYEKALRAAEIPYAINAVQSLFLESPTNDLFQMLQLVQYPDDRFSYVAAMRSPFCRVSDTSILTILEQYDISGVPFEPLCQPLDDVAEQCAYDTCCALYCTLRSSAGIVSIADMIAILWYEGGYRYHILCHPSRHVYLEHGDYLLELARRFDEKGKALSEYVDFLRERLGKNEKIDELELLREETKGVHMMTIHKSKGLEFPIVILANSGASIRQSDNPGWAVLQHETSMIPIPSHMEPVELSRQHNRKVDNIVYEATRLSEEARETAEMKRLFYVAVTRAKQHLVITGSESMNNRGEDAHRKNMMMLLRNAIGLDSIGPSRSGICSVEVINDAPQSVFSPSVFEREIRTRLAPLAEFYMCKGYSHTLTSRATTTVTEYVASFESEIAKTIQLPKFQIDELLVEKDLVTAFGTWCHAVLAHKIKTMDMILHTDYAVTYDELEIAKPKEMSRLTSSAVQKVELQLTALVNKFFSSDFWYTIITENPVAIEVEKPFVCKKDIDGIPTLVHGKIDVLCMYEDYIRIIDFKTDSAMSETSHRLQLSLYGDAVRKITDTQVFMAVCYLRDIDSTMWFTAQ